MNHIKQALRQLVLRPGFAAIVIVMLAVGIGATTAIFSMFHQVLLSSLPVPEPDRLVELRVPGFRPGGGRPGLAVNEIEATFSYPMFRELEAGQTVFTGLAGHYDFLANVTSGTETTGENAVLVSGRYFDVLSLVPALGRFIGPQDEPGIGASNVVVLSHDYWQNRLGGDPNVIGKVLTVNNQSLTVIGVAPEGFTGMMPGWRPKVFVPLTLRWLMQPEEMRDEQNRFNTWIYLFARLRPGVTAEQATGEVNRLHGASVAELEVPLFAGRLNDDQMRQALAQRVVLAPAGRGQGATMATASNPLTLLLGATGLVLLIVCVNITNLLLARGAARAGEMAIRASVGAGRRHLIAQLLAEAAALAVVGGLLALPIAVITLRIIAASAPGLANRFTPTLNAEALVCAAALLLVTVLLFGLLPALQASNTDPGRVIKGRSGQPGGGRTLARYRGALIGVQIALSTVLLVLAGLFTVSLANVARVNLGMDLESLVTFNVSPLLRGYQGERFDALQARIAEEFEAQPGVLSVASSALPVLGGFAFGGQLVSIGGKHIPEDSGFVESHPWISPRFFETLSVPLLAGREFTDTDRNDGAVAIVNEEFVRRYNLGTDVVGRQIQARVAYAPGSLQIVGVVDDARYSQVKGDINPQVFTPRPLGDNAFAAMFFYVRGNVDSEALLRMVPQVIGRVDSGLAINNLFTMDQRAQNNVAQDRLIASLSAIFAALATLLAGVGVYAVLSYNIGERTRELGLRLALGASPGSLLAMVLRQVGAIAAIGGAIGLGAAVGLGRLAEALLFGVSGYDFVVFGSAATVIAVVVLGASYVPARRASKVAPMEALRDQ